LLRASLYSPLRIRHPPQHTLFPYTTLFRSSPTEVSGNTVDHLLDQHRLAYPGTTEQRDLAATHVRGEQVHDFQAGLEHLSAGLQDRKSTRLNSSHGSISYAVFCLKKKTAYV